MEWLSISNPFDSRAIVAGFGIHPLGLSAVYWLRDLPRIQPFSGTVVVVIGDRLKRYHAYENLAQYFDTVTNTGSIAGSTSLARCEFVSIFLVEGIPRGGANDSLKPTG